MSGSGGGYTGGGGGSGGDNCATLIFTTTLSSPKPSVVAKIKKDDQLAVQAESEKGPALALTTDGSVVGSITSGRLLSLLKCIHEGYEYIGIVKAVNKGQVDVEIRPVSRK